MGHGLSLTRRGLLVAFTAVGLPGWLGVAKANSDPLPSWSAGAHKQAIIDFANRVTTDGGSDYVAPPERIATFDNDGTLWVEQPAYTRLAFALDRVKALAPQHPEWTTTQPFQAVLAGDVKGTRGIGRKGTR